MNSVTISIRISRKLKELIESHGARVSEVDRRALEKEVEKRSLQDYTGIMKLASKLKLTFHDAAYLYVAKHDRFNPSH